MAEIKYYIANASEEFDSDFIEKIKLAFNQASRLASDKLKADKIDVVFVNSPDTTIPEIGVGGYSPGPYNIYISLDPKYKTLILDDLVSTILHEVHHCLRYREPGYGKTLGEAIVSEGLATLFEEEISGKPPIYAQVKIKSSEISLSKKHLDDKNYYSNNDWFFGTQKIQRWFGYTYGYKICKAYSKKSGKKASELVNTPAKQILR